MSILRKKNDPKGEVVKAAQERTLCPFIGSGFSVPFGYPTWTALLNRVAQDERVQAGYCDCIDKKTPLEVAEVLHYKFTDRNWNSIKCELKKERKEDHISDVHREADRQFNQLCMGAVKPDCEHRDEGQIYGLKRLRELKLCRLITTNYDKVIEQEVYSPEELTVVRRGQGMPQEQPGNKPTLYKVHGDIEDPGSVILTHTQYFEFLRGDSCLNALLRKTFAESRILFLGYAFRDLNVHNVWCDFLEGYGRAERWEKRAYLVLTKHDSPDRWRLRFLRAMNIEPIRWEGGLGEFVAWLADKANECRSAGQRNG